MFKLIAVLSALALVRADPKPGVLGAARLAAVGPAVVTAQSSQVVARNFNALVAPARYVAPAPLLAARAPLIAAPAPVFAPRAPLVAPAPLLAARAPLVASPYVAGAYPALAASYRAFPGPLVAGPVASYRAAPGVLSQYVW